MREDKRQPCPQVAARFSIPLVRSIISPLKFLVEVSFPWTQTNGVNRSLRMYDIFEILSHALNVVVPN